MRYTPNPLIDKPARSGRTIRKLRVIAGHIGSVLVVLFVMYLLSSLMFWSVTKDLKYTGCGGCTFVEYLTDHQWPAVADWFGNLW